MMLHTIESCFGDIDGRIVADLGCGSGRLLVGAGLLGARYRLTGYLVDYSIMGFVFVFVSLFIYKITLKCKIVAFAV